MWYQVAFNKNKKGSLIWLCRTYGAWSLTLHIHSNHLRIVCVAKWETHKRVGYRGAVNASQWKPFPSMRIHQQRNFVVLYSLESRFGFYEKWAWIHLIKKNSLDIRWWNILVIFHWGHIFRFILPVQRVFRCFINHPSCSLNLNKKFIKRPFGTNSGKFHP